MLPCMLRATFIMLFVGCVSPVADMQEKEGMKEKLCETLATQASNCKQDEGSPALHLKKTEMRMVFRHDSFSL